MARTSLSGFPEWLPEGRIVEMHVLDELRRVFELHGFAGIETRAVETLAQLEAKGETSKEIYVLDRLQALKAAASGARAPKDKGMGLHFASPCPRALRRGERERAGLSVQALPDSEGLARRAPPGGAFP